MSRDLIVLAPNGRRQKVHCTPDTSILQILEDVCIKQGYQPTDYDLKHHNHVLDLTTTIRFSNLPNKATLEMVEADRRREESNVTICLLLADGERRTADYCPNISLHDLLTSLAPNEYTSFNNPTILYMRQEVTGEPALRQKTLRHLGLISGRAILRLLNKDEEARQANVSAIYRCPLPAQVNTQCSNINKDESQKNICPTQLPSTSTAESCVPGPSEVKKSFEHKIFDPIKHIKNVKKSVPNPNEGKQGHQNENNLNNESPMEIEESQILPSNVSNTPSQSSLSTQENLERRLRIEEEVTFLGAQKAIAFVQPDVTEEEFGDLPDDFYDLTIEEVRKLYHELQKNRMELENTPLIPASKKEEMDKQSTQQQLNNYKNAVVRVQFPDRIILQGVFSPNDKIADVITFIKSHLEYPEKPFHIFTTPLKETMDPDMTLFDAKCVPCVHMHFKWAEDDGKPYLREEIYAKQTSSSAASLLASKYRAPSRNVGESSGNCKKKTSAASSSKNKVPKWFK
ncbi:tether containing UBX domain for GLUT4 [Amyelois transitella]|uniref:tether containing UBX domain for GLUT4 n=1 Tax=Amyelois transitella TaxID=680683 RepID=UPI0029904164|nr:tether containing UBX domain for GLUT4 [Amyelois transitella]XP_060802609.1 tether containing UBX domain for GLUT4 [Amyelois transitella]